MATPLDGIRILDFTRYQQGPFATVMLADMGAEVIKVEDPDAGDFGRRLWKEPDGFSAFWEALDRGKLSVCIDLRVPEGREVVKRLVDDCDVVTENFRPGTMERWGLGYEDLKAVHPGIIYGQATGWGTEGPLAEYPSFDQIAQAYSGFAQRAGGGPGARPDIPFPGLADQSGAMNFAFGIMTALYVRERTGQGQKVEVSLLGTQLALQAVDVTHHLHFGESRVRELRAAPTTGHYQCSDGRWVMIVAIDQKFWPRLTAALGVEELTDDPRFARGFPRYQNRRLLEPLLEAAFAKHESDYWVARLREHDVPAAIVNDYGDIAEDEQSRANAYIVERDHPRFGPQRVVGLHVKLTETPGHLSRPAPDLGADTRSVLARAGYSDEEMQALKQSGAIDWPGEGEVRRGER